MCQTLLHFKVSFLWFWIKGKKISNNIGAPLFTKSAAQEFIKRYKLKVRRIQRKKQEDKECFVDALRNWHTQYREGLIKSQKPGSKFDKVWGRFLPHQRFNVDQVPMPFILDKKTTYESPKGRNEKVWIACPGSGLEKRQCSLQLCFSPENDVRIEIIFRGKGKRITEMEKRSYHQSVDIYWQDSAWVDTEVSCEWVEKTLKKCVPEGEEFLLLCDNLSAQVSDEFKKAVRDINGIVYFGLPG